MDVSLRIKQRLDELHLGQRELARATNVTESYISQLLTRRRRPPVPNRTDIYEKMDKFLKLPQGELARLANHQRREQLKRELGDDTPPLLGEVRALILRKCHRNRRREVEAIFNQQAFGELERLIMKSLLDLVGRITQEQLANERWLRTVAKLAGRTFQEMRVVALEFLDTDILHVSPETCITFLDPFILAWDIDLLTFEITFKLNPTVSKRSTAQFKFTEQNADGTAAPEPGFKAFVKNTSLSGSASQDELAFLAAMRFSTGHPTEMFYYRALQNLRDPIHFKPRSARNRLGNSN